MNIKYYSNNFSVTHSDSMFISRCFVIMSDGGQILCI